MAGRGEELLSVDAAVNARLTRRAPDAADSARARGDNRSAHEGNFGCHQRRSFAPCSRVYFVTRAGMQGGRRLAALARSVLEKIFRRDNEDEDSEPVSDCVPVERTEVRVRIRSDIREQQKRDHCREGQAQGMSSPCRTVSVAALM